MGPIAGFVQIVGLLAAYLSQRRSREDAVTIEQFIEWVEEIGLPDIANAIESNQQTTVSIKALLNSGHWMKSRTL